MKKLIDILHYAGKIKKVKRAGWVVKGIKSPESVAEHTYGVAFLCILLAKEFKLNESKLMKMAFIHDLGESIIGEIILEKGAREKILRRKNSRKKRKPSELYSQIQKTEQSITIYGWNTKSKNLWKQNF